eukprot:2119232-Heterocapsa_arctica.AAC.1
MARFSDGSLQPLPVMLAIIVYSYGGLSKADTVRKVRSLMDSSVLFIRPFLSWCDRDCCLCLPLGFALSSASATVAFTPIHMVVLGPRLCLVQLLYRSEIAGHALGQSHGVGCGPRGCGRCALADRDRTCGRRT